jgi:hypothetical protein
MSKITLRDVLRGVGGAARYTGDYMIDKSQRDQAYKERESNLARQMAQQRFLQEQSQQFQGQRWDQADALERDRLAQAQANRNQEFDIKYPLDLGAQGLGGMQIGPVDINGPRTTLEEQIAQRNPPKPLYDGWYTGSAADQSKLYREFGTPQSRIGGSASDNENKIPYTLGGRSVMLTPSEWIAAQKFEAPPDLTITPTEQATIINTIRNSIATKEEAQALLMQGKLADALNETLDEFLKGENMVNAWNTVSSKYLKKTPGVKRELLGIDKLWPDKKPSAVYEFNRARALAEQEP